MVFLATKNLEDLDPELLDLQPRIQIFKLENKFKIFSIFQFDKKIHLWWSSGNRTNDWLSGQSGAWL